MSNLELDIRPEVNILSVLRHLNYKPWFALAEFVDNSLGSYLASEFYGERPLRVSIDVHTEGNGRITITDNAAGIELADFPRAFRAAQVPPDRSGLSEFGMGMKSAASWFARQWRVRTTVQGEPIERAVTFNLDEITEHKINALQVAELPARAGDHYTVVELEGLNHLPQTQTLGKIKSHLTSIYREFIRQGVLEVYFRGEPLAFAEVEVLVAPKATEPESGSLRWKKPIELDLAGGRSVRGFAAVRAVGSTSQAGFALFRRGRLILGSHDEPYRPVEIFGRSNTYTYQRLFGELTLEGFEVSHTKDGFRWEEEEDEFHEALIAELRSEPLNLFAQASGYRAKSAVDLMAPVESATSDVASAVEDHLTVVIDRAIQLPVPDSTVPDELEVAASANSVRREIDLELESGLWIVSIDALLDAATTDWLQVGAIIDGEDPERGPYSRVELKVSLAHPYSRKFLGASNENSELIISLGAAIGLALAMGKLNGAKSYSILHHLNVLLRETFAHIAMKEDSR